MRIQKRKIILPVMVLLLGMTALGAVLYGVGNIQQNNSRKMANLNAMVYSERVKSDIMQEVGVTKALKQLLVSENGRINKFSEVAEDMMMDSVQSIQLAPDGVVTEVYPEEGNEAGKIDLFNDADRGEISRYARDNHIEIMQGPFQLEQGGYGMAVRNPIYLKNENGEEEFWGFTIVIIRVPDVFFDSLKALSDFDYDYTLSKTVSPWDTTYEEVCSSGAILTDPVAYEFEAVGSRWKLEIMPKAGWSNYEHFYGMLAGGLLIVLLLTGLVSMILALDEHKNRFKKLAVTDVLTRINNRHGFEEQVRQYLKKYPEASCVAAQFDIDDFKFINDIYGHESGDKALQILAESMRKSFPEHAVLGRKGGDEFCIFLDNCTGEEVREKLEQFTKKKRSFWYEGEKVTYTISLGYAEYPLQGQNYSRLMRCADAALYEVKLDGKNGCLQYREGIGLEIRKQLGELDGNAAMDELNKVGFITLQANGQDIQLEKADLLIEMTQQEGFVASSDKGITVVMDTNLTPELLEEGFIREVISKLQTMRKDAGFEVMDKIHVTVSGNDKISALIDKNAAQITKIVLAEDITEGEAKGFTKEWNINGEQVTLGVERI